MPVRKQPEPNKPLRPHKPSGPRKQPELVTRAVSGDAEAFKELVQVNTARVRRVVARAVGQRTDVDDVVQMVFFEAYRSLPGFDGRALFSTWLHRIAVR